MVSNTSTSLFRFVVGTSLFFFGKNLKNKRVNTCRVVAPYLLKGLLLHACFYTICLVFRYTSWHFYAFSRTNLLTRCHSASSLFSAIFVFQKSYTGNILGIGQNKSQTSRKLPKLPEVRRGDGEGPWAGHSRAAWPSPGRAPYVCDHPSPLLTLSHSSS
jgi:hypothetical protein